MFKFARKAQDFRPTRYKNQKFVAIGIVIVFLLIYFINLVFTAVKTMGIDIHNLSSDCQIVQETDAEIIKKTFKPQAVSDFILLIYFIYYFGPCWNSLNVQNTNTVVVFREILVICRVLNCFYGSNTFRYKRRYLY